MRNGTAKLMKQFLKCIVMITTAVISCITYIGEASGEPASLCDILQETDEYAEELMIERAKALLGGDEQKYEEIDKKLQQYGMTRISVERAEELTGEELSETDSSGIRFDVLYGTVNSDIGVQKYMKLYVTPEAGGALIVSGTEIVKNHGTMWNRICDTLFSPAKENISWTFTAASMVSYIATEVTGGKPELSEENISNVCSWKAAENCIFMYIQDGNGKWKKVGDYTAAAVYMLNTKPVLQTSGRNVETDMLSQADVTDFILDGYGSIEKAIDGGAKEKTHTKLIQKHIGVQEKASFDVGMAMGFLTGAAGCILIISGIRQKKKNAEKPLRYMMIFQITATALYLLPIPAFIFLTADVAYLISVIWYIIRGR